MDWGAGVDYRLRVGILNEIGKILLEFVLDETTFADRWIEEIENIFLKILNQMKEVNF